MNISESSVIRLQNILKSKHDVNLDEQQAKLAGRAILRLVGMKLYGVFLTEIESKEE